MIEGGGDTEAELYKIRLENDMVMSVLIPISEGVDVYVFEGDTITDIVKQYNMLSGGGADVPDWGLGMMYRCYTRWNEMCCKRCTRQFTDDTSPC